MCPTTNPSEEVHFAPKDRPLRRDVGWLGALLGELLRELAPAGVFETVEAARLAARRRRRLDAGAGAELEALQPWGPSSRGRTPGHPPRSTWEPRSGAGRPFEIPIL